MDRRLVSRIHEEWIHRRNAGAAVHHGMSTTGRLITAAAAIWWMPEWLSRRTPQISIDAELPITLTPALDER